MNTDIYLVRHGMPVLENALLGSTDSPLSEQGWLQMRQSTRALPVVDKLVSSPLSRCAAFAQEYADSCNLSLSISEQWRECHFGDWDGKTYQRLHQQNPQAVSNFFRDPDNNPPPGGETLSEFSCRIEMAIKQLLEKYQGKKLAVITHAGVIRTLVAWCLNMDYSKGTQFHRFAVDYASVTRLTIYHGETIFPQLVSLNQTCEAA